MVRERTTFAPITPSLSLEELTSRVVVIRATFTGLTLALQMVLAKLLTGRRVARSPSIAVTARAMHGHGFPGLASGCLAVLAGIAPCGRTFSLISYFHNLSATLH